MADLAARDPDEIATILGVDGGRAFVQGRTDYRGDSRSYDNLWIIQLAGDGRATAFTEWYMPRAAAG